MKKRILIALALCMALGTACGKKEVEEEKTLRSVEVTTVGKGDIASEFSYTGKAAPAKEVSVVPTVPGKVLSFNYDVGDKVGQGAVLFTVDSTDLQNNMRSLQASYNAAKLDAIMQKVHTTAINSCMMRRLSPKMNLIRLNMRMNPRMHSLPPFRCRWIT